MAQLADILRAGLGVQGRKVPTRHLPNWLMRIVANFDPLVRQIKGELGHVREHDAGHAADILGWVPRPVAETILVTARDMIRLGIVKV